MKEIRECNDICASLDDRELRWVDGIDDRDVLFIHVAHVHNTPAGFVVVKVDYTDPEHPLCYLIIAVIPNERRKGYGDESSVRAGDRKVG